MADLRGKPSPHGLRAELHRLGRDILGEPTAMPGNGAPAEFPTGYRLTATTVLEAKGWKVFGRPSLDAFTLWLWMDLGASGGGDTGLSDTDEAGRPRMRVGDSLRLGPLGPKIFGHGPDRSTPWLKR
jgi:hypothetical protein